MFFLLSGIAVAVIVFFILGMLFAYRAHVNLSKDTLVMFAFACCIIVGCLFLLSIFL